MLSPTKAVILGTFLSLGFSVTRKGLIKAPTLEIALRMKCTDIVSKTVTDLSTVSLIIIVIKTILKQRGNESENLGNYMKKESECVVIK